MSRSRRPQRLVALGADGADILYRLGAWPQVVGVTAFYQQPAGTEPKPRVSGFSSGNLEAILRLGPDLVITSTDVQHQLASDLIKAGVTVWALNSRTLDGIYDAIRNLGQIVRQSERAEKVVTEMEHALRPVHVNGAPRPKVYFEEWPDPLITGIGWVSELIERAGGTDIFAELGHEKKAAARTVSPDVVVARAPRNHLRVVVRQAGANRRHHRPLRMGPDPRRACGTRHRDSVRRYSSGRSRPCPGLRNFKTRDRACR